MNLYRSKAAERNHVTYTNAGDEHQGGGHPAVSRTPEARPLPAPPNKNEKENDYV